MKPIKYHLGRAGIAALLTVPALAIEPPADNAPPPPAVESAEPATRQDDSARVVEQPSLERPLMPRQRIVPPNEGSITKTPSAFLGVISSPVPEILATHLGIGSGTGVVVNAVSPNSPAGKAGLANNDVILSIGDTPIDSPAALSALVAKRLPGDKISIERIHEGKKSIVEATLEHRPTEAVTGTARGLGQLALEGLPEEQAARVRSLIEENLRGFDDASSLDHLGGNRFGDVIKDMQDRMARAIEDSQEPAPGGRMRFQSDATVRLMDNDGGIEIRSKNDGKEVTVTGKDGKVVWSGRWNTEEQKAAAPAGVRERVDKLNIDSNFKGRGFRFQFGGGQGGGSYVR